MRSQTVVLTFEPHEWELLTRLPARIMIAATSAGPDSDSRTVDEGLAGINAIAAGSDSDSSLVRAIVTAIYTEADPDPPTTAGLTEVLISCRAAALVLDSRTDQSDALAYRQWVESIAGRVCVPTNQRFLTDLAEALRNA